MINTTTTQPNNVKLKSSEIIRDPVRSMSGCGNASATLVCEAEIGNASVTYTKGVYNYNGSFDDQKAQFDEYARTQACRLAAVLAKL